MYFDAPLSGIAQGFPITARLAGLPSGVSGTIETLKHMKQAVRDSITDPKQAIRLKAADIYKAAGVAPRDYGGEIRAAHAFVRDKIRYLRDPVNFELVQTPEATLNIGQGDCDDKSTLLAALLQSTGHPARFTVVGFNDQPFSHVLTETKTGMTWLPLETILPKPPGWFPPGVTSKYSKNV